MRFTEAFLDPFLADRSTDGTLELVDSDHGRRQWGQGRAMALPPGFSHSLFNLPNFKNSSIFRLRLHETSFRPQAKKLVSVKLANNGSVHMRAAQ